MMAPLMPPMETPATLSVPAGLVQGLVDSGLIGAERTAALQHEGDGVASDGPRGGARRARREAKGMAYRRP